MPTIGLIRIEQMWLFIGLVAFLFPLALAAMLLAGRAIARREWKKHLEQFLGEEARELVQSLRLRIADRDEAIETRDNRIERLEGRLRAIVAIVRTSQIKASGLLEVLTLSDLEGWLAEVEDGNSE